MVCRPTSTVISFNQSQLFIPSLLTINQYVMLPVYNVPFDGFIHLYTGLIITQLVLICNHVGHNAGCGRLVVNPTGKFSVSILYGIHM